MSSVKKTRFNQHEILITHVTSLAAEEAINCGQATTSWKNISVSMLQKLPEDKIFYQPSTNTVTRWVLHCVTIVTRSTQTMQGTFWKDKNHLDWKTRIRKHWRHRPYYVLSVAVGQSKWPRAHSYWLCQNKIGDRTIINVITSRVVNSSHSIINSVQMLWSLNLWSLIICCQHLLATLYTYNNSSLF